MTKHAKNIEAELIRQNTELKQEVHELKQTIQLLEEQVAFLTKKIYGQSSERINSDQLSLFGQSSVLTEPEQTGDQSEETYQVMTKIRQKKKTRQQRALKQGGFNVSEGTLANWIIKTSQLIEPLYSLIHRELIARHHLQGDETPIQVINEPGRAAKSRYYMWVATTPLKLTNRIVYYAYSQTRAGSFAQKQLYSTYQGVLQCDGYAGYNLLGDQAIQRVGCWAHVRRKFKDAFDADKQYAETPLRLINSMFRLEKTWQHFSPRVRRRRRRSKIRPLLKRFWQWVDHYDGLDKSRLGKAVTYAADQRMYLSRIVNDGTMD